MPVTESFILTDSMLIAAAILVAVYALVFSEIIHRMHGALIGAVVMVAVGMYFDFYTQEEAIESIDANTIFLLGGMMMMVGMLKETGGFDYLAIYIAKRAAKTPIRLLVLLTLTVSLVSMILDNVTTVIIFAPLTVLICEIIDLSPMPYLVAEAMLSNVGGIATLVGDPPNIMIASAAHIDFNTFLLHMGPVVAVVWVVTVTMITVMFRHELTPPPGYTGIVNLDESKAIHDVRTLKRVLAGLFIIVVLFFIHHHMHLYPSYVTFIGLSLTLVMVRPDPEALLDKVEWPVLVFFSSLFVVVGGVESSGFLQQIGNAIASVSGEPDRLLLTTLFVLWGAGLLSAFLDNIPFTVAMIPIILSLESTGINAAPLWWALALGAGLGGNGTHIGATANIICVAESERCDIPEARITPGMWLRRGFPVMIASLLVTSLIFVLFFDFFL
ncbi:MAG TPA: citrate transporter [Gammaproteobacteria bacterium]|nr:citrate transporter [Gammaproteobacteria bacterium]